MRAVHDEFVPYFDVKQVCMALFVRELIALECAIQVPTGFAYAREIRRNRST